MDNLSRVYSARYRSARELADAGERLKALEICWDLRNDPNVSLLLKSMVNLLIARIADIRKHPDKSKFAYEAFSLVGQIHLDFAPLDSETEHELCSVEECAERRLVAIEHEKRIWAAMKGNPKEEALQARLAVLAEIEREKAAKEPSDTVKSLDTVAAEVGSIAIADAKEGDEKMGASRQAEGV